MHMKTRKRFLALVAAASMVLAPCVAFAAGSESGGTNAGGEVEGVVDMEVFTVVLPTITNQLDFKLDPQQLAYKAQQNNAAKTTYSSIDVDANSTILFENQVAGGNNKYSSTSDDVTIESKSAVPVNVKVEVIATGDAIDFATSASFTGTKNEIYLAITGSGSTAITTKAICVDSETKKATATGQIAALNAGDFEVKWDNAQGKYTYTLKDGVDGKQLTFRLTGASNSAANWLGYEDLKPSVDVVWTVTAETGMQTVSSAADTIAWTDRTQPYTFQVDSSMTVKDIGVLYEGVVYDYNDSWGGFGNLSVYDYAVVEGNTITLNPVLSDFLPSGEVLYIFFGNDPWAETDYITVPAQ